MTSAAASPQPGVTTKFYTEQRHFDTVVFVHGILGHYVRTWGLFPALLTNDPDLPELDLLLWGYPTGWLKRHHELKDEGQHFISAIEALIQPGNELFLVGHSMGGLILLRGLVDRMILGHAQTVPCVSVSWITLFASPLNGAWAAGVIRLVVNPALRLIGGLHKHLRDLARGSFCDGLMVNVVNHIYRPKVEDNANRTIPIRIVVATRDGAVDEANRVAGLAMFLDPPPLQLDEDHSSVKLPNHVGDLRYRVLSTDLQVAFQRKFRALCSCATTAATLDEREAAFGELLRRYGRIIRRRVSDVVSDVSLFDSAEKEFLLLMAMDGAKANHPPFDSVNRATVVLAARHKNWR